MIQKIDLKPAITASLINGERLWEDARNMLDYGRPPTAFALAILAQEEYSKAFILSLVDVGAIKWTPNVKQVLREHVCKQLASLLLDYLYPETNDFSDRIDAMLRGEPRPILPNDIVDAIHVICHERIPKNHDRWWIDDSERPLDLKVKDVADGKIDRRKQQAIYVGIGKDGRVTSLPSNISNEDAQAEVSRAERFSRKMREYQGPFNLHEALDSEKLIAFFRLLSGLMTIEDFNASYAWR